MMRDDLLEHAQSLLVANAYLTLGTVGPDGRPWTTPVYFAASTTWDFYWMSSRESRHSRHLDTNPRVSLVVFDSTVQPYHGRALYAAATAQEVPEHDLDRSCQVYPGPPSRGASTITPEQVSGSSSLRLYRARASDAWVLCPRPPRQACRLHGRNDDHRARIHPVK